MLFQFRLSLILLLISISSFATEAPSLRCVSVTGNGDIILTWQPPSDPLSEFFSYHIYSSTSAAGPYADIITINTMSSSSFTHIGAGGNITTRFYYVKTFYGAGGSSQSAPSDTLQAIFVSAAKPFNNNAVAGLSWNPIHHPILQSSASKYKLYKEYPTGNWFLLDSTANTSYADTNNGICNETFISYRIEISDNYGCTSVSNIVKDKFKDEQPPLETNIVRVSVDPSGKANISWEANHAKDLKGYVIFKKNSFNQFTPIASNVSKTTTDYTDPTSSPELNPEIYSIAAFDSCSTTNYGVFDTAGQSTIHLNAFIDLCYRSINLSWNKYVNWKQGVKEYQIFRSENGAPYSLLINLDSSATGYKDQNLIPYNIYSYYIVALENGGELITSNSNITPLINNTVAPPPSFLDIITASVDFNTQKIQLQYEVDTTVRIKNIRILRSSDNITFSELALLPTPTNSNNLFTDITADPSSQRYFYKVTATDSCDRDVKTSDVAGTMFLQVTPKLDLNVDLTWNDYYGWDGDLLLFRSVNQIWEINPFLGLSFSVNFQRDDITPFLKSLGKFCYYIKARKSISPAIESNSNIACAVEDPKLYVPNSFTPNDDGLNDTFLPVNIFVDPNNYSMIIYDRWGNHIFESNHPETGWDGRVNGKGIASTGIYAYHIKFTSTSGLKFEKTGSISLIK